MEWNGVDKEDGGYNFTAMTFAIKAFGIASFSFWNFIGII